MDLKGLITEFREYVTELQSAVAKFKRLGKVHKTPAYRARRIAEATSLWDKINKKILEIDVLLTAPDPCYDTEKSDIKKLYKEYTDELKNIIANDPTRSLGEELQYFLRKQEVRFDALTRIIEDINDKMVNNEQFAVAYCKTKIKSLNEYWNRVQIEDENYEDDRSKLPADYATRMVDFEQQVDIMEIFLEGKLEVPSINRNRDGIKVQRVTLPKFQGDYFKWVSFRDLFTSIVKNNTSLSDAERMQVLKTNLGGEAEKLIADLTISDINFASAWDRLTNRYDNNRVVVYKHLNKLLTQQWGKSDASAMKKLLDTTDQILLALQNLGRPTDHWDDWIVLIITQKFSDDCRKDWEKKVGNSTNLPTWLELKAFMEEEFRMLEGLDNSHKKTDNKTSEKMKTAVKSYQTSIELKNCPACPKEHKLFSCPVFKGMNNQERWDMAKRQKLCFACLNRHDGKLSCEKPKSCKKCNKKHNTWLHDSSREKVTVAHGKTEDEEVTSAHGMVTSQSKHVLLATTLVATEDIYGQKITLRALVDSGSQGSMITERAASLLKIKPAATNKYISGLGGKNGGSVKLINISIQPRFNSEFNMNVDCYILKKITKTLPDRELCTKTWKHLKGLILADPTFYKVGPIDLLLGTDVVSEIMQPGFIKGIEGKPMAQQTTLGWIVSGNIDPQYPKNNVKCLVLTKDEEQCDLRKFWEMEDLVPKRELTPDERICEELYQKTFSRNHEGIFTVKIPFKEGKFGPEKLGASKGQCVARFMQLEKRFLKDPKLKLEYSKVMEEYLKLGHMVDITNNSQVDRLYYIPHHVVIKMDSLTTKMRVVFDASAKTTTGISLNDCMYTGAKQQKELLELLIKWRMHRIVFKADIEKMYRQIKLDAEDQQYHTILWRNDPTEEIKEYQLKTVTFGTAAAPFMAIRTLIQIGLDIEDQYPRTADVIKNDFYVDDLVSGCDTIEEAEEIKTELIRALKSGGLSLRKWTSNNSKFLSTLPTEMTEKALQLFTEDDTSKALGLQWNPKTDVFNFKVTWVTDSGIITKRKLLSEASKLFDPLGWLAPVIINAKLWMQEVWVAKIKWDDEVPDDIKNKWLQFRTELSNLEKISIKRWCEYQPNCDISLHGFCDASEKAYAAVIYSRIKQGDKVSINLIASKTRVSPLSMKVTLPRLELCGAVLLANLMKTVKEVMNLAEVPTYAWTDSMITLGWLNGEPSKWKTFVANRVAEVQSIKIDNWNYVKSKENPADCASRGVMPNDLKDHLLWWSGPSWLANDPITWELCPIKDHELEQKKITACAATIERKELLLGGSSWFKQVRVMAYILRMKGGVKNGSQLTVAELERAKMIFYKRCQQEAFPYELSKLQNNQQISNKSRILQLNPFLDEHGVMRVGGRLQNAVISFNNKHPIILPYEHQTTRLIVHQMHLDTLHGGPQLMVGLLRKKYWILNAKRAANSEFQQCTNCRRFNSHVKEQLMGSLPKERVTLERAFLFTGIDYAGPIEIRASRLRKAKLQKGYIAVFVCFGTKAIHLELVSDMSTPAFMAALNRFIARRGLCQRIYSDNGSNFLGTANRLMEQERQFLQEKNNELAALINNKGIEWKFIPPGSPHQGGIWERGVRSVKDHLKRTLKGSKLTFEEYATVLCQIEACLNSRPLCPLTSDAENLNALTPGHFLIGEALMAPPQPQLLDINTNKLDRWKHLQLLQQHFWNRWHVEYLNQLQKRHKWKQEYENVKLGDLVLVKDEQLAPRHWLMGRIVQTHPGTDGRIRVVTLRTFKGSIKRPITKICPLLSVKENIEDRGTLNETQDHKEIDPGDQPTNSSTDVIINLKEKEQLSFTEEPQQEIENHDLGSDDGDGPTEAIIKFTKPVNDYGRKRLDLRSEGREQKTKYTLRPKMGNSLIMMAIIFGFIIGLGAESSLPANAVQVDYFVNNAGIYYEDLGRANTVKTEWHMFIKFGLNKYWYEFKRLQDTMMQMKEVCVGIDSGMIDSHCDDTIKVLNQNLIEMKNLNMLITSNGDEVMIHETNNMGKQKRAAPLNFVGWIQHEVFGLMDADQAEHIENQFELVDQNNEHVMTLLKKQTSIVENTLNLVKNSQDDINENYGKITKTMDILANETNRMKRKLNVFGLAVFVSSLMERFEKTQRIILDMITDVHQGQISSYIFTPQQFKEHLKLINENLPVGSKLPENAQHDVKSLYKMIRGQARVTKKNILVDIKIPLISSNEYQVLHVIPIPIEHEGNHLMIIPDSEYLMITLKKDNYYQMNERELHTCMKPSPTQFICKIKGPLYNVQSNKSQCERNILVHNNELSSTCKFKLIKISDYWIPLHKQNAWIFGVNNQSNLNVLCDKEIHSLTIQGTGMLQLRAGCEIIQHEMTLLAESIKYSEGDFNFYPTLNLSEAVNKASRMHQIHVENLTLDHTAQMNAISQQLSELDNQSVMNRTHHKMHYGNLIGIWITLTFLGCLFWIKRHYLINKILNWYKPTITALNDVELGKIQHGESQEFHHNDSDASQEQQMESSTVARHRAGECPFRT